MRNYIIRIYREGRDIENLVGIVEEIGVNGKKAFTHFDELCEILNSTKDSQKRKKKSGKTGRREKAGKEVVRKSSFKPKKIKTINREEGNL